MNLRNFIVVFITILSTFNLSYADEGMWLPLHISRLNYTDMQKAGLELTAEEIYSINNSSLKDAIVMLNGCTAEMISAEGLMLTNHHCAYGVIQSNSTVENNILEMGFWAMNRTDELPAEGMTASFLVRMEDVTDQILEGVTDEMSESERDKLINAAMDSLQKKSIKDNKNYRADVKSMFAGNRYYLFIYETYTDVRLVAAPPESIGKFGGDTDNWMWPRHTGDFSMLRIYSDKDGKPAKYNEENIPLKPKHHLPVSLNGVKQNDFAMIMGYPGSTTRYLTSYGVLSEIATTHKARIKIRGERLDIYKKFMDADPTIRLKYASAYAGISNYYKNSIGMVNAIRKLKVVELKAKEEKEFRDWLSDNPAHQEKYGEALPLIESSLKGVEELKLTRSYIIDAMYYSQIVQLAWRFGGLANALEKEDQDAIDKQVVALKERAAKFYKDYDKPTDKSAFAAAMKTYYEDIPSKYHPELFKMIDKKFKGDFEKFTEYVYKETIFCDENELNEFLDNPKLKDLVKDPGYLLAKDARALYFNQNGDDASKKYSEDLEKGRRLYLGGLMEMQKDRKFYPDANFTMRLTYGNVLDYDPRDAVDYNYFTTIEGVMEKEDTSNFEFHVPSKLKELYDKKDFGQYGENGTLVVNFITNNDITGGNSGSPVINGKGQLIGCAFDGNWEALSGDIAFENNVQRTIVCDIRYILFIVDKYAGATHLIKEMTLVKNNEQKPVVQEPVSE